MLSPQQREELRRMRDALADRMHHYDERVEYGTLSFEEKHLHLSQEFGGDYQETLASINQMLHERPAPPRIVPKEHLKFLTVLLCVVFGAAILLSVTHPSLVGQSAHMQLSITEQTPVQLSWTTDREIRDVDAYYHGSDDAELTLHDATGEYVLITIKHGVVSCPACGMTASAPVMLELTQGNGALTISSIKTRQKP